MDQTCVSIISFQGRPCYVPAFRTWFVLQSLVIDPFNQYLSCILLSYIISAVSSFLSKVNLICYQSISSGNLVMRVLYMYFNRPYRILLMGRWIPPLRQQPGEGQGTSVSRSNYIPNNVPVHDTAIDLQLDLLFFTTAMEALPIELYKVVLPCFL